MKKIILLISALLFLSACQNHQDDRPFHWNGQDNGESNASWEGCRAQANCQP